MTADRLYHSLEHRFDGEIPDHLRRSAMAGGDEAFERTMQSAAGRACDRQALLALGNAAARRAEAFDLPRWRRQGLTHRG